MTVNNLIGIFEDQQKWLMDRILHYAEKHSFIKHTSTPGDGLRQSVVGLTESLVKSINHFRGSVPELDPDEDLVNDPMTSFAVLEAKRHRERGIPLSMFLGFMKYYKQSYVELLGVKLGKDPNIETYRLFVERSFDRFEIAFCQEWATKRPADLIEELQNANRLLTGEKNFLAAIFENAQMLMAYLDTEFNFIRVNKACAEASRRDQSFFTGKNLFELYPNREYEPVFRKVLETGEPSIISAKPLENLDHPERGITYWNWSLIPTKDLNGKITGLVLSLIDVTDRERDHSDRAQIEKAMMAQENMLMEQDVLLEQKNVALMEIMGHVNSEKEKVENQVRANIDQVLFPILTKLKERGTQLDKSYLNLIEENLKNLSSAFGQVITKNNYSLTRREIEVCNMIRNGLASKEIARMLHLSIRSVENHRKNIRRKLKLTNKNINLGTFLSSF